MGAIVSAVFLCVVYAIHATGADVYTKDTIVGVVLSTGAVVLVIHATGDVVYAIHATEGFVCAMDGFVCVIRATDSSVLATRTVDFATGLLFCVSTSSMGDVSAIPAIARKRKFSSSSVQMR